MDLKNFFKPTKLKVFTTIIIVIILVVISHYKPMPYNIRICSMEPSGVVSCGQDPAENGIGYPVFYGEISTGGDTVGYGWYPLNLVINILVCYTLSCGLVVLCKKLKNKYY